MSVRGVFVCAVIAIALLGSSCLAPADATAQPTTVDSSGDAGWQTSIAIDSRGFPHIGYITSSPTTDLKYARMTAAGWSTQKASETSNPTSATNLVLDRNDNPAMATGITRSG